MRLQGLAANFDAAIESVYKYEGGFQKQSADTGNFRNGKLIGTNLGITPNAYFTFYKEEPTEATMKALTKAKASPIYRKNYWDKVRGDEIINDSVAELLLDIVVNSGTGMVSVLKQIMNDVAGKKIVAVTSTPFTSAEIALLNSLPADKYFNAVKAWRERFYNDLVKRKPSNSIYLKGWLNRLNKHVYSGKVSAPSISSVISVPGATKNPTKIILIGLGIAAAAAGSYYMYKRYRRSV